MSTPGHDVAPDGKPWPNTLTHLAHAPRPVAEDIRGAIRDALFTNDNYDGFGPFTQGTFNQHRALDRVLAALAPHLGGQAGEDSGSELADALTWVLPMAKGYAHSHPVGNNWKIIEQADERLAEYRAARASEAKRQKKCEKCGILYTPMTPDEKCPTCRGVA